MAVFSLPSGYPRIRLVDSFHRLVTTPLADGVNALCWPRTLSGDFHEVVKHLTAGSGITTLDEARLRALPVSAAGRTAIDTLLEDQRRLGDLGLSPVLDCIGEYPRDESAVVPTDVYSFHVDSAPVPTDTYLCCYNGPASEGLRNDQAVRRVDVPETRARLLELYGGPDGEAFREFLVANSYTFHFAPTAGAQPFSFGVGNLWRIAVDHPGSPVPPCIHRAPATRPGQPPRLLLIS